MSFPVGNAEQTVDAYLHRLGLERPMRATLESLQTLMRAHLTRVPFENIDVYDKKRVSTSIEHSLRKVVADGRGGWCFELNGAFGWLLEQLGFRVIRLGAAVLSDGPNDMVDHLTLEVALDEPYLVDVGFGESFIAPLRLNTTGSQSGGNGAYEFIPSPRGTTLLRHSNGGLEPQYRFKRVALELADFDAASDYLQDTPGLQWTEKRFATRLEDGGPSRLTLLSDRLKRHGKGEDVVELVDPTDWDDVLYEHFTMRVERSPR